MNVPNPEISKRMLNAHSLAEFSSDLLETAEEVELRQRLSLYQVFLKIYNHHRGLLDEILDLENPGTTKSSIGAELSYMQGMVMGEQVYLSTNLLKGHSQVLLQPQNTWTIGRDSKKVVLPIHDRHLSRCHAAIRYIDNQFQLIDLDSSNGSYVNGELVREAVRLKDGDRIRLGILTFSFFLCRSTQTLGTVSTELLTQLEQSEALSRLPETYANLEASHARIFDTSSKVQAKIALEDTNLFPKSNQSRNELSQS